MHVSDGKTYGPALLLPHCCLWPVNSLSLIISDIIKCHRLMALPAPLLSFYCGCIILQSFSILALLLHAVMLFVRVRTFTQANMRFGWSRWKWKQKKICRIPRQLKQPQTVNTGT